MVQAVRKQSYQQGDIVDFTFRGSMKTGTVIRSRIKTRKGRARELALMFRGDEHALDSVVVEISAEGRIYTVGIDSVKGVVGTGSAQEAINHKIEIKQVRRTRAYENSQAVHDTLGWTEEGAEIEVQFKHGWETVIYRGVVTSSGKVRFEHRGQLRTTWPKFVRPVKN